MARLCFSIAYVFSQFDESLSIFILKGTRIHAHDTVLSIHSNAQLSTSSPLRPHPTTSIQSPLEHCYRVRGIRRSRLGHIPMLNNACAIHPVNVCQRNGFRARRIDTYVNQTNIVIEALTEDYKRDKREDCKRS